MGYAALLIQAIHNNGIQTAYTMATGSDATQPNKCDGSSITEKKSIDQYDKDIAAVELQAVSSCVAGQSSGTLVLCICGSEGMRDQH